MSISEFWNMSPMEVADAIESSHRRKTEQTKELASVGYILASSIANQVGALFNENNKVQTIFELFPELFKEEYKIYLQEKEEAEFQAYKERRKLEAAEFNRNRK